MRPIELVAGGWLLACGCSSGETAGASDGLVTCSVPPLADAGVETAAPLASSLVSGHWSGRFLDFTLPSGSDALSVEVTERADGTADGTIVFGSAPPPPPPTDASTAYPPGFDPKFPTRPPLAAYSFAGEGFRYPLVRGKMIGGRVTLYVNPEEVFRPWCALQCPIATGVAAKPYRCLPNWPSRLDLGAHRAFQTNPASGIEYERDWVRFYVCSAQTPICTCSADRCTVVEGLEIDGIPIEATNTGDSIDGHIDGILGFHAFHLARVK